MTNIYDLYFEWERANATSLPYLEEEWDYFSSDRELDKRIRDGDKSAGSKEKENIYKTKEIRKGTT